MNTFSNRLKHARQLLGYTQLELARASGLSQSAIASYESGNRHSSRSLRPLASALKVSFDWLDTGKGEIAGPNAYALPVSTLREPGQAVHYPPALAWPFKNFTTAQYAALSPQQKQLVEALILTVIQSGENPPRSTSK